MRVQHAALALVFVSSFTSAQSYSTFDQGWYNREGHDPLNTNYFAGECGSEFLCQDEGEHRNFFTFDLSHVSQNVVAAALVIPQPIDGYRSGDVHEEYELFDVLTDIATLLGGTGGLPAFEDLGSGRAYGATAIDVTYDGSSVTIPLTSAAIADLNALLGGPSGGFTRFFSIGGRLTSLDGDLGNSEFVFGFSGARPCLLLDVDDSTAQTVLVIGDGPGLARFRTTNAVFPTQLDRIEDFAILGTELPAYPLPGRLGQVGPAPIPDQPAGSVGSPFPAAPEWMSDRNFTVQVLVHDPERFPAQPFQWSKGLRVRIRPDGSVLATRFGEATCIRLQMEVFEDARGEEHVRFPFAIDQPDDPMAGGESKIKTPHGIAK